MTLRRTAFGLALALAVSAAVVAQDIKTPRPLSCTMVVNACGTPSFTRSVLGASAVLHGAGAPAATVGVDGDFYVDATAHKLYGPKASGTWPGGPLDFGWTSTPMLGGNNLSDLASAATARANLGVTATGGDTTYAYRANNLSDLASAPTARTNLGLTAAATCPLGTAANNCVQLNGSAQLPALDSSQLTALNGSNIASGTIAAARLPAAAALVSNVNAWTAGQSSAPVALTDGATIAPDMSGGNIFTVTLGGNRTLANPSNLVAGQCGQILITQDGTGSRTLAYGANWKFPGGTVPTLSTAAGALDILSYCATGASAIAAQLSNNFQ